MKIVFIAAHPDDIEYGCAGTIRRMIDAGIRIFWILMSNGENDVCKNEEQRLRELNHSANFLGVNQVICMNYPDGAIPCDFESISKIKKVIEDINPDAVLVQYYDDRHQDHRNTSVVARSACWGTYNILYYRSFSTMNFEPSIFVDITDVIADKKTALALYISQIDKFTDRGINYIDDAVSVDKKNGGNIHTGYAEGYLAANCVWKI